MEITMKDRINYQSMIFLIVLSFMISLGSGLVPLLAQNQKEAYFNFPYPSGTEDTKLEEVIQDLLELAKPGSDVFVSMYTWTRPTMAEAFVKAYKRGVHIQIIMNFNRAKRTNLEIYTYLTHEDRLPHTVVKVCYDGCHGNKINHNKFILFSELSDGSRNVVVQSSANLTWSQLKKHNNLVVIRDDLSLYNAYLNYWFDLHRDELDLDYYTTELGNTGTKVYFFPRESGDTILNILNNINGDSDCEIRIAMSIWKNERSYLVERLAELKSQGCSVRVIVNERYEDIIALLTARSITYKTYPVEGAEVGTVHSKYLLVKGNYSGVQRKIVWTGAHNYSRAALKKNDETLLKITDDAIYDAFIANWEHLWSPSDLPDLIIENLTYSQKKIRISDEIRITAVVKNQGTGIAAPTTLRLVLQAKLTKEAPFLPVVRVGELRSHTFSIPQLPANGTHSIVWDLSFRRSNQYEIIALADERNFENESDENNNDSNISFTIH